MKIRFLSFLMTMVLAAVFCLPVQASQADRQALAILSQAVALVDADTGQLLYGKNAGERMYPASMTKIMTALLVIEQCSPYELITVSQRALDAIEEEDSTNIGLQAGEQLTVEQALYALMLPSANDAANALAEHAAGSLEEFARQMTQLAHEIGAVDTQFTNAHGLHEDSHYTTPRDMALITAYAMHNEKFRTYFGALNYDIPPTNLSDQRKLTNSQAMLNPDTNYYHPDVVGGKTGFTLEAMYTLSTYASRDERNLVSVVMYGDVRADTFDDTRTLLNFGFDNFTPVQIGRDRFSGFQVAIREEDQAVGSVTFNADRDFSALLYTGLNPQQIEITYSHPRMFSSDSEFVSTASFSIPDTLPGVPQLLGEIELEAAVFLPNVRTVQAQRGFSLRGLAAAVLGNWKLILAALGIVLLFMTLAAIGRRRRHLKKQRLMRQRRLQERNRAQLRQPSTVQYGQRGVAPRVSSRERPHSPPPRSRAGSGGYRR